MDYKMVDAVLDTLYSFVCVLNVSVSFQRKGF
jgi:hypothetical protein